MDGWILTVSNGDGRFLISGAAPLSAELQATLERRLDNAPKRKHKSKTIIVQGFVLVSSS